MIQNKIKSYKLENIKNNRNLMIMNKKLDKKNQKNKNINKLSIIKFNKKIKKSNKEIKFKKNKIKFQLKHQNNKLNINKIWINKENQMIIFKVI